MPEVLIDTSAWILFLRQGTDPVSARVDQLIRAGQAVLTGPVLAELMQGCRSEAQQRKLLRALTPIHYVEVVRADWTRAGDTLGRLRRKGITVPLSDAVIATVARRNGLRVLSLDKHFQHLNVPLDLD